MRRTSVIWTMPRDEFVDVVKSSHTFTEILRHFNIDHIGGNCRTLKRRMNEEDIDYSHISQGVGANRGKCYFRMKRLSSDEVLTRDSRYSRKTVRRIVLRENLLEYKCAICDIGPVWNDKELSLRLDHINGVRNDHKIENLRFLCPNCDSQTNTYGSRNFRPLPNRKCCQCDHVIPKKSKSGVCFKCSVANRGTKLPPADELRKMVWAMPSTHIAAMFGVSDKAVAKWCKKYGINKPGPGYWAKIRSVG